MKLKILNKEFALFNILLKIISKYLFPCHFLELKNIFEKKKNAAGPQNLITCDSNTFYTKQYNFTYL